jgi:His/Glu/Gln/Arg/opine family amino acid ABC transporter permease subunit
MMDFLASYGEYWSEWFPRLLEAGRVTLALSALGFGLALVTGSLLVMLSRSPCKPLRLAAAAIVEFLRAVPLLALLLALYFGLPAFGLTLSGFSASVIGLGIQGGAYVAEILRGGLDSVHRGQREAALAAGLAPRQVFACIILPQMLRVILPPMVNCYVTLLKDSSLCALIATPELMLAARAMSSEYFLPLQIFVLVGLCYFVIAFPLSVLSRQLSKRLSRGRRSLGTP